MATDWINGFIIPIVSVVFIGGICLWIAFIIIKAFRNAWTKQTKFVIKYKIFKKEYPTETLQWCIKCIEEGIGYYDAKKLMLVNMCPEKQVNETLWIYDQMINELNIENKKKGGKKVDGRNIKASYRTVKNPELPKF